MQKAKNLRNLSLFATMCTILALGSSAHATETTIDYAALATSTKEGIFSALGAGAPVAFAVLAGMLGLGVVWRLVKRGAKSV